MVKDQNRSVPSVLLEAFAGTGGEDSKLFLVDLFRAYLKYADRLGIESEIIDLTDSSVSIKLDGKGAWEAFKSESGKHVVQRIPPTETKGRRHTSVISVSVMPFPEELDCILDLNEVDITTTRGGGPGGQAINKLENTVIAIHNPTGIRVRIQTRSQHTSKKMALTVLAGKVAKKKQDDLHGSISKNKQEQLGGGERSGKIRTYNFISGQATDHRTGRRTGDLKALMKGSFDLLT